MKRKKISELVEDLEKKAFNCAVHNEIKLNRMGKGRAGEKKSLVGWVSKDWRIRKREDGSYEVAGHGLWDKKHSKDDVKVRITIEEVE